jgi:hypothetical protein
MFYVSRKEETMTSTIVLSGHQSISRDGGIEMLHTVETVIAPGNVQVTLTGIGPDCATAPPVVSKHPEVERWEREKDRIAQVTAYRNRPIKPRFKPEKKRRRNSYGHQ